MGEIVGADSRGEEVMVHLHQECQLRHEGRPDGRLGVLTDRITVHLPHELGMTPVEAPARHIE